MVGAAAAVDVPVAAGLAGGSADAAAERLLAAFKHYLETNPESPLNGADGLREHVEVDVSSVLEAA